MLAAWPLLRCLPLALSGAGNQVVVFAHAQRDATRIVDGTEYRFVNPGWLAGVGGRRLNRWKPRHGAAYYFPATRLVRALRKLEPDVVHFGGLTLDLQLAQVARACERMSVPLVAHFHGGTPALGQMLRVQRYNAERVSRVLVTTAEQAEPWIAAGLYDSAQFAQVIETSSPFLAIDRHVARARTGMVGDPVYLSAGRLHQIKDPLTMLGGFERIVKLQTDARLYLYYLTSELLPDIHAFLNARPAIAERVELRGRAAPEEMEAIYSSADFLLQASRREWSGLSVLEAMSCGCIPIVSDIPSFRAMTVGGRFGRLFAVGDANGLAEAAVSVEPDDTAALSRSVRDHFKRELSFAAMARKIDAIYHDLRPDLSV
ncbi:MAG: glycosyltransferase family 4 protein [Thermomicrobiales bacterium]